MKERVENIEQLVCRCGVTVAWKYLESGGHWGQPELSACRQGALQVPARVVRASSWGPGSQLGCTQMAKLEGTLATS